MPQEDRNKFYNASKYYLVDIFNGEPKISNVHLEKIMDSKYHLHNRMEVKVVSTTKDIDESTNKEVIKTITKSGFIKSSEYQYMDDLDIINSEVAALLGINASKIFRLITNDNVQGTITLSVLEDDYELIGRDYLMKRAVKLAREGRLEDSSWLDYILSLSKNDKNTLITDRNTISNIIRLPLHVLQANFQNNDDKLIKNYVLMILFDYITGENLRNLDTYSILFNPKNRKVVMAPIYDFNNTINTCEYFMLNGYYLDRKVLIDVLFNEYYLYIKDITRGLDENINAYKKSLSLIIKSNTKEEYASRIREIIYKNLDNVLGLEHEMRLDFGESRIDMALTQTSINLNAVNRNQTVRDKYEKLVKKEIKVPQEIKEQEEELVKISVEESKQEKENKGLNIFLFILIMVVVCLIGVGIAFLIYKSMLY